MLSPDLPLSRACRTNATANVGMTASERVRNDRTVPNRLSSVAGHIGPMLGPVLGDWLIGGFFFRRRDRPRVVVHLLAIVMAVVIPAGVWSFINHPLLAWALVPVAYVGGYRLGRLVFCRAAPSGQ